MNKMNSKFNILEHHIMKNKRCYLFQMIKEIIIKFILNNNYNSLHFFIKLI